MRPYSIDICINDMHRFDDDSEFTPYACIIVGKTHIKDIKYENEWWDYFYQPHFGWVKTANNVYARLMWSVEENPSIIFAQNPFKLNYAKEIMIRQRIYLEIL